MFLGRRPLRFDPMGFVIGFLLIAGMYAAFVFVLWLAFGDAAPEIDWAGAFR